MKNIGLLKKVTIFCLIVIGFPSVTVRASDPVTFAWEWDATQTSYTAGNDGDVAFYLYMRTEEDENYDVEYPALEEIDNCSLNENFYTCQATLTHTFEPGVSYFFSVAAYLRSDQTVVSSLSNEVEYFLEEDSENTGAVEGDQDNDDRAASTETSSASASSGGGGCFVRCL